jgi:hypothetical protein
MLMILLTASNVDEVFTPQTTSDRGDESSSSSSSGTGDGGLAAIYTTRSLNSSITLPGALVNYTDHRHRRKIFKQEAPEKLKI